MLKMENGQSDNIMEIYTTLRERCHRIAGLANR